MNPLNVAPRTVGLPFYAATMARRLSRMAKPWPERPVSPIT